MIYSFILIPNPELCGSKLFNKHRMFFRGNVDGKDKEIYNLIAINCQTKEEIAQKVEEISSTYLANNSADTNIKSVTWASACNTVLANKPLGTTLPDDAKSILAMFHVQLEENACIYLAMDENDLSSSEHVVIAEMLSLD